MDEETKRELEAIEHLKAQIDFNDIRAVKMLYDQLYTRNLFHTKEGLAFMAELSDICMKNEADGKTGDEVDRILIKEDDQTPDDKSERKIRNHEKNNRSPKDKRPSREQDKQSLEKERARRKKEKLNKQKKELSRKNSQNSRIKNRVDESEQKNDLNQDLDKKDSNNAKDSEKFDISKASVKKLKRINTASLTLNIILVVSVIFMFYINSTINSPNILNYEEKLQDKYSEWEQDLTERENTLKKREQEVLEKEKKIEDSKSEYSEFSVE